MLSCRHTVRQGHIVALRHLDRLGVTIGTTLTVNRRHDTTIDMENDGKSVPLTLLPTALAIRVVPKEYAAVSHALELGATLADFQPQKDVRVLQDPAGHPFCLYVG
jgi:hypothetical protein